MQVKTKRFAVVCTTLTAILLLSVPSFGQTGGGYVVVLDTVLPNAALLTNSIRLDFSPNKEDVKSIGMGRVGIAGLNNGNAMLYNPAVLAKSGFSLDLLNVSASLPSRTFSAAKFIRSNLNQFQKGDFLHLLEQGYKDFLNAPTLQDKINAVQEIKSAMKFPDDLVNQVSGNPESPNVHGMSVLPSFQLQLGNIGVSLFSQAQLGFVVRPGQSIANLVAMQIPDNPNDVTPQTIRTIAEVVGSLFDSQGNLSPEGLPQVTALTFVDIAGVVGYGMDLGNGLDVGASLKILNRRFSVKNIDAMNLGDVIGESSKELQTSVTGFTLDAGARYTIEATGTKVALSLQNIIPIKTISSTANFNFNVGGSFIVTDNNGNPVVGDYDSQGNFVLNPAGDTAVVVASQKVNVGVPIELKAPFLCTIGAIHPINEDWTVGFEIADLFANDEKYDGFADRIRIGTEYRLLSDIIALRLGFAAKELSYGLGLNFKIVQIDAASAQDTFIGDRSYYLQLKVGW